MNYKNSTIEQKAIIENMVADYNHYSAAHNYIFGYSLNKKVYFVTITNPNLIDFVYLDIASKGGYCIKYRPNSELKEKLNTFSPVYLCTTEELNDETKKSIYNKGEIFEKRITNYFGLNWKKDNLKFSEGGDISLNGVEYQIKYEKASFVTEKTLNNLKIAENKKAE